MWLMADRQGNSIRLKKTLFTTIHHSQLTKVIQRLVKVMTPTVQSIRSTRFQQKLNNFVNFDFFRQTFSD